MRRGAQLGDDGLSLRLYLAPEPESNGRLFDQHAQAVGATGGAVLLGKVQKRRGPVAVHHVIGEAAGCEQRIGQRERGPRQAGGCGIDDAIERNASQRGIIAGFDDAIRREVMLQRERAADRAIGDD